MSTKEVVKRLMHYVKPYGALLVGMRGDLCGNVPA